MSSNGYINGKPDPAFWMQQVRAGIAFRKKYAHEDKWKEWRKYYRGEWKGGILPTNIFFKMVRTLVPRVYFRNPSVSITPQKPGDSYQLLALILERMDNKLLDVLKIKKTMKAMVQDSFMFGTAIGSLGYGAQFTPTPDLLGTEAPADKDNKRQEVEYNQFVRPDMPWFLRTPTGNFIVPANCANFEDARWTAKWSRRHISDVQADKRFKHVKDLRPGKMTILESGQQGLQLEGMIDLVQIRDKKTDQVFVMAPYASDKILLSDDDAFLRDMGRPADYPLIFNMDDEVFWGISDSMILDPQQREANEIRTMMMKHRRVSIRKLLAKRKAISVDEAQKLTNEDIDAVVYLDANADMNDVKPMEMSDIPAGLIKSDMMVLKDVQEILGLGSNQFGDYAPGSADRSATEAQIVNQATQIRIDERRDALADLLVEIVDGMNYYIFNHWTGKQVVDLVGDSGVKVYVEIRPEMLKQGHYAVNIDPDSNLPQTKQLREQKAVQSYQILATNPLVDKVKLTKFLLHELHGVSYDEMMVEPGPQTPMMQGGGQTPPAQAGKPGTSANNPMQFAQLLQGMRKVR